MRILILTLGSRGDVQPFAALASALAGRGHDVAVATSRGFEAMIEAAGAQAVPLSVDIQALAQSPEIRRALRSLRGKIKAWRMSKDMMRRLLDDMRRSHGLRVTVVTEAGPDAAATAGADSLIAGADSLTATAAEADQAQLALQGAHEALGTYPPALVRPLLQELWIVGGLEIRGYPVGGTYLGPRMLLASDHLRTAADRIHAERFFHHEFSSYLFLLPGFPEAAYLPDYEALLEATQEHAPAAEAETWRRQGFVSDYGRSSLENDVNTYAELLMADPAELLRLGDAFPRIAIKARLLAGYYAGLHPDLKAQLARGPAAALLR